MTSLRAPSRASTPAELPPGPDAGPLLQGLLFHRDPLGVLLRCRARYGEVFTLSLPTARRTVVVADPAAAHAVAATDPLLATTGAGRRRLLGPASPQSVLGADREAHRAARTAVGPAFTPQALEPQRAAMASLAAAHATRWPRERPFRLLPRVKTLADDVFVRCLLGVRDEQRAAALVLAIRRMLASPGTPPMPIPSGGRGLLGVLGEAFYRFRRGPAAELLRAEMAARSEPADADLDVLSCLRRAGQSDTEIVEAVLPLLMAGQEPAAIGVTWVLDRAAREAGAAERLAPGRDAWSDAFVAEALRLRPPVHSLVRPLTDPFAVAGRRLPAGTVLVVPIPLLHLDPRAFPEPAAFRPERFLAPPPPDAYLPFGFGVRRCLGEALAELQFATLVPAILSRLRLKPIAARPERQIVRATVLPPQRGPAAATSRAPAVAPLTGGAPACRNRWWAPDERCTLRPVRALLDHRRVVAPLVAAVVCLVVAQFSGPIVAWLTLIATFGFILDAVTIAWPKGDNLTKYRQ